MCSSCSILCKRNEGGNILTEKERMHQLFHALGICWTAHHCHLLSGMSGKMASEREGLPEKKRSCPVQRQLLFLGSTFQETEVPDEEGYYYL